MNRWRMGAVTILFAALVGCGGNNTRAGITITAATATAGAGSVTVPINGAEQFAASVTGVSDTQVYWQVCLPITLANQLPTACTTIPNVTPRKGDTVLTGYGTINQNGFYTAPSAIPAQNNFIILATSPVDSTAFGTYEVVIDSGIRVQVTPAAATIDAGNMLQLTATVTGTSNTSVTWEVNSKPGGDPNDGGTISPSGLFTSEANSPGSVGITAVAGADGVTTGSADVTILNAAATLTGMEPRIAAEGSAQQEIYLTGTNFTTNGSVLVNGASAPFVYLSASLLRAIVPGTELISSGTVPVQFQPLGYAASNAEHLTITPVRPSLLASTPASIIATGGTSTLSLTGGFFEPATTVQFDNGNEGGVTTTTTSNPLLSSRQLSVALPTGAVARPGLYPVTVQNTDVAVGLPSMSALNISVTPTTISAAPGVNSPINLGGSTQPSAIAMDAADGLAIVAEKGANAVALVNLSTNAITNTVAVGAAPTGVAVDDSLPHHLALVVNSGDNTVSVIDLSVAPPAVTSTISLTGFTPITTPVATHPYAIGINPQTHRAFVANASTNLGTVIDLVNPNETIDPPCTVAPCPLTTVGGNLTGYGTGANPAIAVDPTLNWAVITPGGAGVVNIVDLGFGGLGAGSGGRAPAVLATLALPTTTQGVGINPETHTAIFTDDISGNVTTFSLLNNSVNTVTNNGTALVLGGEAAAAVDPLQNIGIAVNSAGTGTASVVDLTNHVVLQTALNLTPQGGAPGPVAIDPLTNQAFIADSGSGAITVLSLGGVAPKPLQILDSNPAVTFTSANSQTLTITGTGFVTGSSTVLLDGTALAPGNVNVVSARQIVATVPASLLTSARRFIVQVENSGGVVSNVEPLTVIQAIAVGSEPAGVAVDPNRDLAIVTNSGSGNISVVSLISPSVNSQSLGPVGVIGDPLGAHSNPRAVAVDARIGLAVAANFDSNDLSLVDYSENDLPQPYVVNTVPGCSQLSVCDGPAGIAFDQDTNGFIVTDSNIDTTASDVAFGTVGASTSAAPATINSPVTPQSVDPTPGDIAIAPSFDPFDPINNPNPNLSYAAIASSSQSSVIDFLNTQSEAVVGRTTGLVEPTGVIYDALNRAFLVSDSLGNNIAIVNPLSFVPVFTRGGFNPSSIAYNSQTSTLVAVNAATGTLSFLDYLCPPLTAAPYCTSPQVRTSLGLVGSQIPGTNPLGAKTIDIDPYLNIAVAVDSENNRVLLVPLPN
jgi:DNA-binding beta-propeller fold protein YncE